MKFKIGDRVKTIMLTEKGYKKYGFQIEAYPYYVNTQKNYFNKTGRITSRNSDGYDVLLDTSNIVFYFFEVELEPANSLKSKLLILKDLK